MNYEASIKKWYMNKKCNLCGSKYGFKTKYCKKCANILASNKSGRQYTRMKARVRDDFTCQDCGLQRTAKFVKKHNESIIGLRGRIKNLDIHHLDGLCGKVSRGYDSEKDLDLLITLCHKCHYNRHDRSERIGIIKLTN